MGTSVVLELSNADERHLRCDAYLRRRGEFLARLQTNGIPDPPATDTADTSAAGVATISADRLEAYIRRAVIKLDLRSFGDVFGYLHLCDQLDGPVDRLPAVNQQLSRTSGQDDGRILALVNALPARYWSSAAQKLRDLGEEAHP